MTWDNATMTDPFLGTRKEFAASGITMPKQGDDVTEAKTWTTPEVAEKTGIPLKTIQFWVREKHLKPMPKDNGKAKTQKRIIWTKADVQTLVDYNNVQAQEKRAREIRDLLLDTLGKNGLRSFYEALGLAPRRGQVAVAGPKGARIVQESDTMRTVLERIGGSGVILPRE